MSEDLTLFDMSPDEKFGEIDNTKIEYIQLAFEIGNKKIFYQKCEDLLKIYKLDNYSDLIYKLVRERHEKIKT
jgi:hypothetical protein